jgi:short-subunit dehydrogenase
MTVANDYSYGPTKAYLVALSKALASTYKEKGVNVMALCPGFTHTDFHASERLTAMKVNMPKFAWYSANVVIRCDRKGQGCLYFRTLIPIARAGLSSALDTRTAEAARCRHIRRPRQTTYN